ncbi:TRAM domain-containing protein [Christensenellaceae bacterium OttesenSCG-928-M15]|nr:TRAM domain-containing protein [Christensenellaceae bacterium OttesenSCG-928-M15]
MAQMMHLTEERLTTMPLMDIFFAVLGLIVGLLVALLLSTLINRLPIPWLATPLSIGLYLICGYLGVSTAMRRRVDLKDPNWPQLNQLAGGGSLAKPKILDTSVIIDGRIFDIAETGVIEGIFVVPGFVLKELRHIADSSDALKRGRGRRGLDILQKMQKELDIPVKVEERDYEDISEVDLKLLKLAQDLSGVVVTNDYNLNKVAGVQNVPVFNINDLANAIKPVVLPGEELSVSVVKEGKEAGQGIGYLDDGTMIVIDGGKRLIGEEIVSIVTSVLQTSAGRMIFARVK